MKEQECSICSDKIYPEPVSNWDKGHNAYPVNEGRCCSICNDTIVTPVRIMMFFKDKEEREIFDEQKEKTRKA